MKTKFDKNVIDPDGCASVFLVGCGGLVIFVLSITLPVAIVLGLLRLFHVI
jgi:hypothetical protein